MQCRSCQYELPAGVAFCPNCGTPAAAPAGQPVPPPSVAPTVFASSPNQEIPPTVAAMPAPGQPLSPSPSYAYAPPPANYSESAPPPPTNYGESAPPPPPLANPYSTPQVAPYDPTYPPQTPPVYAPGTYAPQPAFPPVQQPQKKTNGCVIALVIVLVVFVVLGGTGITIAVIAAHNVSNAINNTVNNADATLTALPTIDTSGLTPAPTTGSNGGSAPTTGQVDANAASIITAAQTSSNVDSNGNPTDSKSSFSVGDTAYISFTSSGQSGYVLMKLYRDGNFDVQSDPLSMDASAPGGYFPVTINNPGQFVAGVYWCTQSDCSDAALARVVTFSAS
jgi:hypothetical protein